MGLLDGFLTQGATPPNPDATWPQMLSSPMAQGLLGAVASYAANARRGSPINSLGRGGVGGLLAYGQAQDRQTREAEEAQQREVRALQLGQLRTTQADQDLARQTAARFFQPATPAAGGVLDGSLPPEFQTGAAPVPAKPASFDMQGFAQARMQQNPIEGMKLMAELRKEQPINKLDVKDFTPGSVQKFAQSGNYGDLVRLDKLHFADTGGAVAGLDPFTGRPVSTSPKTGNPFNDLIVSGPDGRLVPNSPLIGAKSQIAKSGASSVKIENKMGESIAGQVGPMLRESFNAANGAAQQVDAANRIVAAIDTNKVFAGPGSGVRMKVAQVSQMLGVGGKDDAEKIANTRQAIRGLSEMTLQGRKQMTGQGAITESEGALAEKAQSGNIEDLTAAEIKQLAQASARAARFVYGQHEQMLTNVGGDPNTAGLAKFYKPMPMPTSPLVARPQASPSAGTTPTPMIDSLVEKYSR